MLRIDPGVPATDSQNSLDFDQIAFHTPHHDGQIAVEISYREAVVDEPYWADIGPPYYAEFQVPVLTLEETVAEKLRTLLQRLRPTDLSDLATPAGIGRRGVLLFAMLITVIAMYSVSGAPRALAGENFCGVTLQPYGHSGDRCYGVGHPLFGISLVTYERSGCMDVANSSNELLEAWTCEPAKSAPAAYELHYLNDGVRRKGVIRNNNLSLTGFFAGAEACYSEC